MQYNKKVQNKSKVSDLFKPQSHNLASLWINVNEVDNVKVKTNVE